MTTPTPGTRSMWRHRDVPMVIGGGLGCLSALVALTMIAAAWWGGREAAGWLWWLAAVGVLVPALSSWRSAMRIRSHQLQRNRRASAIRDEVLAGRNPARPYFVYLRPFAIDGAFVEAPRGDADERYVEEYGLPTAHHDLETALALLVYRHSDLVALSDEAGEAGAGYVHSTERCWEDEVAALCAHAEGIFIVPFDYDGTAREVAMIGEHGWQSKTFAVMPARPPLAIATVRRDFRRLWEAGRARYPALQLPPYDADGCILHLGPQPTIYRGFGAHRAFAQGRARQRDLAALGARLAELARGNGRRGGDDDNGTPERNRAVR